MYRGNTTNRRQNRAAQIDHGEYDGLPIRHWRRDLVTVTPASEQDRQNAHGDVWAIELPHGMPKDAQLLPQHCQDLLRAARSGKIYKRPSSLEDFEVEHEVVEKPDKKEEEEDAKDKGFTARAWKQVPRHQEGPDLEYLARRRKGLVLQTARLQQGPTFNKLTIRRTDAAGNEYVADVIVAPGETVEGVVISQVTVDAAGDAVPTPPKRKAPPIPKKRKGGPGRGKKKVKIEEPTGISTGEPGTTAEAGAEQATLNIKAEDALEPASKPTDGEHGDESNAGSDDDGEDGDDNDEDDEDDNTPATNAPVESAQPVTTHNDSPAIATQTPSNDADVDMADVPAPPAQETPEPKAQSQSLEPNSKDESHATAPPSTSLPPAPPASALGSLPTKPPSPIKPDTSLPAKPPVPTYLDAGTTAAPTTEAVADPVAPTTASTQVKDALAVISTTEAALADSVAALPPPPPEPSVAHVVASATELQAEAEEEAILLETLHKAEALAPPEAQAIADSEEQVVDASPSKHAQPEPEPEQSKQRDPSPSPKPAQEEETAPPASAKADDETAEHGDSTEEEEEDGEIASR